MATAVSAHTRGTAELRILDVLGELIDAIDRRLPQIERAGEKGIATVAAALRAEAVSRIEHVIRTSWDERRADQAVRDAIMTDDGAPPPASPY